MRLATQEYIDAASEICQARGALLIIDEIQTGFLQNRKNVRNVSITNVNPDVMCLAKAIAGGVPMGAILVNDRIETKVGSLGSTFGGKSAGLRGIPGER